MKEIEFIKEMWEAIKPKTREDKIALLKDLGKLAIFATICGAILYFGCLLL